jgi:hypothetical protein
MRMFTTTSASLVWKSIHAIDPAGVRLFLVLSRKKVALENMC